MQRTARCFDLLFLAGTILFLISNYCVSVSAEPPVLRGKVVMKFHADEAVQGVAFNDDSIFAIADAAIGKYDIKTGKKTGHWQESKDGPIIHLNSGIVEKGILYTAHSNWPVSPVTSSIECFDTKDLKHIGSFSFGILQPGTLTWLDRKDDSWFAAFGNYDAVETFPGRGSNWSYVARLNDDKQPVESWIFPKELMPEFGGYAASGGAFDEQGNLYVSGHDAGKLYKLEFPKSGSFLKWTATITAPFAGQAFTIDKKKKRFYTINRKTREVIVFELGSSENKSNPAKK